MESYQSAKCFSPGSWVEGLGVWGFGFWVLNWSGSGFLIVVWRIMFWVWVEGSGLRVEAPKVPSFSSLCALRPPKMLQKGCSCTKPGPRNPEPFRFWGVSGFRVRV